MTLLRFLAAARGPLKRRTSLRLPLWPAPSLDVGIGERQISPVCGRNAELMVAAGDCGSRQCKPRSAADDGRALSGWFHTSFENPAEPGAPPRESIEVRTLV